MAETIDDVYRDYNTPGNPASGDYEPVKSKIRRLLKQISGGTAAVGDYRGPWDDGANYVASDLVEFGGSIWYAKIDNNNVEPTEGATWTLFLPGATVADGSLTTAKYGASSITIPKLAADVRAMTGDSRKRAIPAVFAPLANYGLSGLHGCVAPGMATYNTDVEAVYDELEGSSLSGDHDLWVDWVNGSDLNNGAYFTPYKTVKAAMASGLTARTINMKGTVSYEQPNWTAADGALVGGVARAMKLRAAYPNFNFMNPPTAASAFTWTADGTYGNLFNANTAYGAVHAVFFLTSRTFIDENGISQTIVDRQIIPYYTTKALASAAEYGFTQVGGVLSIRVGTMNIETNKASFQIIYAGGQAKISGANMFIKNITFFGISSFQMEYGLASGTWNRPKIYMQDCGFLYSSGALGYGFRNLGGIHIADGCKFIASTFDGVNADPDSLAGGGQEPWGIYSNCKFVGNGLQGSKEFVDYIAGGGVRNVQGASYHEGLVVHINDYFADNFGQNVADTQSTPTGGTWMIGCQGGPVRADLQVPASASWASPIPSNSLIQSRYPNLELQSANTWIDTCSAGGRDATYGLVIPNGAHVFNSNFDGFTAGVSGTATFYDVTAP